MGRNNPETARKWQDNYEKANGIRYITEWNTKNRVAWLNFFKRIYGKEPICEICGKVLTFGTENRSCEVCFDHRRGNEMIQGSPARWYRGKSCNEKNKQIWFSCDFGILCLVCNASLPTIGRKDWLDKAQKYANEG